MNEKKLYDALEKISKQISDLYTKQERFYNRVLLILDEYDQKKPDKDEMLDDKLFNTAKKFVIKQQNVSTSLLQRKFSLKYSKACLLIDRLEEEGIVSGQNKGVRTVLVK